ncbi:hypothetical protein [Mesorhizobium sp. ORS 3428]|uniref:hypothetical protein n=1 Tax=Mesorhizobium sp. ORS 3428 TaxID=540997 RepID=UPI000B1714CD
MAERRDDESESRRILERVARETRPGGVSFIARTAKDARDRMTAADADRSDPIEYWGTRIGRTLGLIVAIGSWPGWCMSPRGVARNRIP